MKKIILLLILTLIAIYLVGTRCDSCRQYYAEVDGQKVAVDIADSDEERIRGLSGREEQSMLFIFDKEDFYGIWMKDMLFPIDIIWIDKDLKVVHVERDISPETHPEVFQPETKALYILEIPTGLITVEIGDIVDL